MSLASNGDIIGCGIRWEEGDPIIGWLFRLSPEGELLWERSYLPEPLPDWYPVSFLYDVKETPDGGLAAVGLTYDTLPDGTSIIPQPDIWLLKVGPDGCFEPGCTGEVISAATERQGGVLVSERQAYFRVSPNPTRGEVRVEFLVPPLQRNRLRLFSAQGFLELERQVPPGSEWTSLDFSEKPPGLYSVVLEVDGQVVQAEKLVILP